MPIPVSDYFQSENFFVTALTFSIREARRITENYEPHELSLVHDYYEDDYPNLHRLEVTGTMGKSGIVHTLILSYTPA